MNKLIEEAEEYANNVAPCKCEPLCCCLASLERAAIKRGVEWALHKIAGEGRCTYFFGPGEELCAITPEAHRDWGNEFLPEFRHEFQP